MFFAELYRVSGLPRCHTLYRELNKLSVRRDPRRGRDPGSSPSSVYIFICLTKEKRQRLSELRKRASCERANLRMCATPLENKLPALLNFSDRDINLSPRLSFPFSRTLAPFIEFRLLLPYRSPFVLSSNVTTPGTHHKDNAYIALSLLTSFAPSFVLFSH